MENVIDEIKRNIEPEVKFVAKSWNHCMEVLNFIRSESYDIVKTYKSQGPAYYYDTPLMDIYNAKGSIRITGNEINGNKVTVKAPLPEPIVDGILIRYENSRKGGTEIGEYKDVINELYPNINVSTLAIKAILHKARLGIVVRSSDGDICDIGLDVTCVMVGNTAVKVNYDVEFETVGGTDKFTRILAAILEKSCNLTRSFKSKYETAIDAINDHKKY